MKIWAKSNAKPEKKTQALLEALKKAKPSSAKGAYLKKVTLSTTMGPGLTVDFGALAI